MEHVINILLVEKDRVNHISVKRELAKRKILHRLFVMESCELALTWMPESSLDAVNKPDIILVDLETGAENDFELLSCLNRRAEWRHCKVFILSVAVEPSTRMKTSDFSIARFIVKPMKIQPPGSADELHLIVDLKNIEYNLDRIYEPRVAKLD